MRISGVSANFVNKTNFNGMFREVSRNTSSDNTQRYEVTYVHSVYHPNKNESEAEIRRAMSDYEKTESYGGGQIPDGGYGTSTQAWSYDTIYTCERGGRLPY